MGAEYGYRKARRKKRRGLEAACLHLGIFPEGCGMCVITRENSLICLHSLRTHTHKEKRNEKKIKEGKIAPRDK